MNRLLRGAFIPLLVIVLAVWLASTLLMSKPNHAAPGIQTYSQLQKAVEKGQPKFKEVVFNPGKRSITATEVGRQDDGQRALPERRVGVRVREAPRRSTASPTTPRALGGSHGGR